MMRESQGSSAHNAIVNNKKIRGPSVVFFEENQKPEESLKQIMGDVHISEQEIKQF